MLFQYFKIKLKSGHPKINYYDFIMANENTGCSEAVKRIVQRIDIEQISNFLDGTPYISERQKEFYKYYISSRLEKILQPAFELSMSDQKITMQQSPCF